MKRRKVIHSYRSEKLFKIVIQNIEGFPKNPGKHSNIQEFIKCPILLQGNGEIETELKDLYVSVRLVNSLGTQLCSEISTKYKEQQETKKQLNELIIFPVRISELTRDTFLEFTIYDSFSPLRKKIICGTSINIFDAKGFMFQTKKILRCYRNEKGNFRNSGEIDPSDESIDELTRILVKLEQSGEQSKLNPILDQKLWKTNNYKIGELSTIKLKIEFKNEYSHPILFARKRIKNQQTQEQPHQSHQSHQLSDQHQLLLKKEKDTKENKENEFRLDRKNRKKLKKKKEKIIFQVKKKQLLKLNEPNWIFFQTSPENKMYRNFVYNTHLSVDRNHEPLPNDRERLIALIRNKTWVNGLSFKEKEIIWKYRYWIQKKKIKGGVVKFLYSVDWETVKLRREAISCLKQWNTNEINGDMSTIHDALELLSNNFKNNKIIRQYGVKMLKKLWKNEEEKPKICGILLQLVQALKYEKSSKIEHCSLFLFLIDIAINNIEVSSKLYWHFNVECKENPKFEELKQILLNNLNKNDRSEIVKQHRLINLLSEGFNELKKGNIDRVAKIKRLKQFLKEKKKIFNLIFPVRLPLDTKIIVKNIEINNVIVFKSATQPLLIPFITKNGKIYQVIYKEEDDLRQDQIVLELIRIMDQILIKNALNLQITPYNVLACTTKSGLLEAVFPNCPLQKILNEEKKQKINEWLITKLIKQYQNDKRKISLELEDRKKNYIYSTAGYSVMTYILGIGDRHLDNLLLKEDGKLVHIDFGFILGEKPKSVEPPIKLNPEMIEAMGGKESEGYNIFLRKSTNAYKILRKYSKLFVNMLLLMIDSGLKIDNYEHKIRELQDKLMIESSQTDCEKYWKGVVEKSVSTWGGWFVDVSHDLAQKVRK